MNPRYRRLVIPGARIRAGQSVTITATRTGLSPRLVAHISEPFVEIHPDDARGADAGPQSFERRADRGRVVREVVVDGDAADLAEPLEPALDADEIRQRGDAAREVGANRGGRAVAMSHAHPDLLAVASRYGSFPILVETYRECLADVLGTDAVDAQISIAIDEDPRAVRFELEEPEWVMDCNCSHCRLYGGLWAYYPQRDVHIVGPVHMEAARG